MAKIKICGITCLEDALYAASLGVDAIGFVFYPQSRRYIPPERVRCIVEQLPPFISTVGVFVDEEVERVMQIARYCGLDMFQFHGDESPEYCRRFRGKKIKSFRVDEHFDLHRLAAYRVDAFLLDPFIPGEYGGTGKTFNWALAKKAKDYGKIILAGGLTPENVEQAITEVEPYGVDVSSGVELLPGKKDLAKMRAFVERVRGLLKGK